MKNKTFHIPVFVPHKGCPHDCVFCNQRRITGQIEEMTPQIAANVIDSHLNTIEMHNDPGTYYAEIAFFGGSFTAVDVSLQTELLTLAYQYVCSGRVHGIRCSTRPDCISDEVLDRCVRYGMTAIELGVQSADDRVLCLSNRGHTFDDVERAATKIKERGIELGLQMMTGLPGDTYSTSMETARKIARLSPDCVRIYPTLVMDGTHLMDMYKSGEYIPQTVEEAVKLVSDIVPIFEQKNIRILRIGLQTTDGVNECTVKGPWHGAFAELVYGRLIRNQIEKNITADGMKDCVLNIDVPRGKMSQYVGHKKENIIYFKEKYNIDIKFSEIGR